MSSTKRIGSKLAVAGLVAAVTATTGMIAYAQPDEDKSAEQQQELTEDADGSTVEAEGEIAGGLPEELPDKAVADSVIEVVRDRDSYESGREFGAAVSEAAKQNSQAGDLSAADEASDADEASAADDAPDGVRQDADKRQDGDHRPADS